MNGVIRCCWPALLASFLLIYATGCSNNSTAKPGRNLQASTDAQASQPAPTGAAGNTARPGNPVSDSATSSHAARASHPNLGATKIANAKVDIQPVTWAAFQEVIKRHHGRVILIDYWMDS